MSADNSAPSGGANPAAPPPTQAPETPQANAPDAKPAAKPAAQATPPSTPAAPETYTLTVDGQERTATAAQVRKALGMADDEPITKRDIRALQIEVAARSRMSHSDRVQKAAQAQLDALGSDPIAAVARARFGGDMDKAEAYLLDVFGKRIEERTMPADKRKEVERQRELEAKEAELERLKAAEQERQGDARVAAARVKLTTVINGALKGANLRATPHTIARMAGVIEANYQALDTGEMTIADCVTIVRDELSSEYDAEITSMPIDALLAKLEKSGQLNKIRAADAARLTTSLGDRPRKAAPASNGGGERKPPATTSDFMRRLRES